MEIEERIQEIEDEIKKTQKNKATERHLGLLKAKVARLKELQESRGGKGGRIKGIRKKGDATCAMCGPPSVGKSTLMGELTNAESRVADYEFTTLNVIEGMMLYRGAYIQILDTPGLIEGASRGKGRGREVLSSLRIADLLIILLDTDKKNEKDDVGDELYEAGIRLNWKKPLIDIKKRDRGGIEVKSHGDEEFIRDIARERGIHNAEILVGKGTSREGIIDFFSGNVLYMKAIWILNKIDDGEIKIDGFDLGISAKYGRNIDLLKARIFSELNLMQVYTDGDEPMILEEGGTVRDFCKKIHRDFEERFKYARIWGKSTRYNGQFVGLEHVLKDGDKIRVELRR